MDSVKENKKVQAYSLPPHQIAWLRQRAAQETTDDKSISASNVLERILDEAIARTIPLQEEKKRNAAERDREPVAA